MRRIHCLSRIALTGSPLSNNLDEYYSLIDWVAPGFLGSSDEFKSTYSRPISEGLWKDCPPVLYREARKRLKVLLDELDPKIHRADASILHNSLFGKLELVIKVPLTSLQHELYVDFVKQCGTALNQTDLWSCVNALTLLCTHPKAYLQSLIDQEKALTKKKQKAEPRATTSSDEAPDTANLGLPDEKVQTACERAKAIFDERVLQKEDFGKPELGHKANILLEIIKLSKAAGDKVLVFSHRIPTLEYMADRLLGERIPYILIHSHSTPTAKRPEVCKTFNESNSRQVALISTTAGGQGLNLYSANRVVILDENFNPMHEQQAIGRAYRFGQKKRVYVYRLQASGTFEMELEKQGRFKEQLADRVVDKKALQPNVKRNSKQYIYTPKQIDQEDLNEHRGKDEIVLDHLIANPQSFPITSITPFETFSVEDTIDLTVEEQLEAEEFRRIERLRRTDPQGYMAHLMKTNSNRVSFGTPSMYFSGPPPPPPSSAPVIMGPIPPNQALNGALPRFQTPMFGTAARIVPSEQPGMTPSRIDSGNLSNMGSAIRPSNSIGFPPTPGGTSISAAVNLPIDSAQFLPTSGTSSNEVPSLSATDSRGPVRKPPATPALTQDVSNDHSMWSITHPNGGVSQSQPNKLVAKTISKPQFQNGLPQLSRKAASSSDESSSDEKTLSWSPQKKSLYAKIREILGPSRYMVPSPTFQNNTADAGLRLRAQMAFRKAFSKRGIASTGTSDYLDALVQAVGANAQSTHDWNRLVSEISALLAKNDAAMLIECLNHDFDQSDTDPTARKNNASATTGGTVSTSKRPRSPEGVMLTQPSKRQRPTAEPSSSALGLDISTERSNPNSPQDGPNLMVNYGKENGL